MYVYNVEKENYAKKCALPRNPSTAIVDRNSRLELELYVSRGVIRGRGTMSMNLKKEWEIETKKSRKYYLYSKFWKFQNREWGRGQKN